MGKPVLKTNGNPDRRPVEPNKNIGNPLGSSENPVGGGNPYLNRLREVLRKMANNSNPASFRPGNKAIQSPEGAVKGTFYNGPRNYL